MRGVPAWRFTDHPLHVCFGLKPCRFWTDPRRMAVRRGSDGRDRAPLGLAAGELGPFVRVAGPEQMMGSKSRMQGKVKPRTALWQFMLGST